MFKELQHKHAGQIQRKSSEKKIWINVFQVALITEKIYTCTL